MLTMPLLSGLYSFPYHLGGARCPELSAPRQEKGDLAAATSPSKTQLKAFFTGNRCLHQNAHGPAAAGKDSENSIALSF